MRQIPAVWDLAIGAVLACAEKRPPTARRAVGHGNMVELLDDRSSWQMADVGMEIHHLRVLKGAGLRVVPTIVIPNTVFTQFEKRGSLPPRITERILSFLNTESDLCRTSHCCVRSSCPTAYVGLIEELSVERNITAIKYAVETVFRSWHDDTARASRYVDNIEGKDGFPAVCIQPKYDVEHRLGTRTGHGEITTKKNYPASIRNEITEFRPVHRRLLRCIERAMAFPTEVTITDHRSPQIITATRDEITDSGIWRVLSELFAEGVVSEIEYLNRVDPDMLVRFADFRFSDANSITLSGGLPASPGTAIGPIRVLRHTVPDFNQYDGAILVVAEVSPEDIDAIYECAGMITVFGGMTSHAAAYCRGLEKPLVINNEIRVDQNIGAVHQ